MDKKVLTGCAQSVSIKLLGNWSNFMSNFEDTSVADIEYIKTVKKGRYNHYCSQTLHQYIRENKVLLELQAAGKFVPVRVGESADKNTAFEPPSEEQVTYSSTTNVSSVPAHKRPSKYDYSSSNTNREVGAFPPEEASPNIDVRKIETDLMAGLRPEGGHSA